MGESTNRSLKIKGHPAMPWLVKITRSPGILDALKDLMGPDIMLFGASRFSKGGKDRAYVSWHQDSAYFGLDPHEEIAAWVAFTHCNVENGGLRVSPRSHLGSDMVHEETYAPDNMLTRGQSLQIDDGSSAMTIELKPGEFSLHHERTRSGTGRRSSRGHEGMDQGRIVGTAEPETFFTSPHTERSRQLLTRYSAAKERA